MSHPLKNVFSVFSSPSGLFKVYQFSAVCACHNVISAAPPPLTISPLTLWFKRPKETANKSPQWQNGRTNAVKCKAGRKV
jgi:hypothetical protein